jgi:hypothetical protein
MASGGPCAKCNMVICSCGTSSDKFVYRGQGEDSIVPAALDRMAEMAREHFTGANNLDWENCGHPARERWRNAIRVALIVIGIRVAGPCQYCGRSEHKEGDRV